jgi:phage terminase small subunit
MKALPSEKHRMFVLALYQVKSGYGANVKAAKLAGFGTKTSSAKSWSVIASRLAHDERILAAIREMDEKMIRSSAPRAIRALSSLIETPNHKDHAAESRWC